MMMGDFPKVYTVAGKFMALPRDHVNAYVVETERAVVVVDSTLASSSGRDLRRVAESCGKPVEAVLLTHGHPDHWGGLIHFADVPRYGSQGALDFAREEDRVKSPTARGYLGDDWPEEHLFIDRIVADGDVVEVDGATFTFTDLGPGESPADGMWTYTKDGMRSAFVGDVVANRCHSFVRDLHVPDWFGILDRLEKEFADQPTAMYVGHGATPASVDALDWQRGYLNAFLHAAERVSDRSEPVSRGVQEQVVSDVQEYLPGEANLFLLDYELDVSLPRYWKLR
jgi:glyoxylase-like metal-dependent hydrolase (beta-lactamase superfamily II)